jgi:hypothetical protein
MSKSLQIGIITVNLVSQIFSIRTTINKRIKKIYVTFDPFLTYSPPISIFTWREFPNHSSSYEHVHRNYLKYHGNYQTFHLVS